MKISEKLTADMKTALKAGEKDKLTVIRMLRAELKNAQIAAGDALSDESEQKVLQSYAKKRKEAREQALEVGRQEIADKEQSEYDIVMSYLPEQLDEAALTALIQEKIEEAGAQGVKDMGRVIKAVMASAAGQADGKTVSTLARKLLGG
jgi:uncharacterized protein YqeY